MKRVIYSYIALILAILCGCSIGLRAQWRKNGTIIYRMVNAQRPPQIVSDGEGGVIVAWKDFRYEGWDMYVQRLDPLGTLVWDAEGVPLCTEDGSQHWINLVADESGGAIAVWLDMRNGWGIYAQGVDSSGAIRWTLDGKAVCLMKEQKACLRAVSDGSGGAVIVWVDLRNNKKEIFAQRINSDGMLLWSESGVALCEDSGLHWHPEILADGAGGVIAVWQDRRYGSWDIFAQKVGPDGALQWAGGGVPACVAIDHQFLPVLAADGAGGAIITWHTWRRSDRNVYAQRIDASGTMKWRTNGIEICTAPGNQRIPKIISDMSGGAIITWVDDRNGTRDIYAQRIDRSGGTLWKNNGIEICAADNDQWAQQIIHDGESGAILTWHDMRNDYRDVYAQKINLGGTAQWIEDGVAICTAVEPQVFPQLATDGDGGAIFVWVDLRKDDYSADLYAEKIDRHSVLGYVSTILKD